MTDASSGDRQVDPSRRGFFDGYPRFRETSQTAVNLGRLNLRHRAIIENNRDVLRGARVLDLASHDGRWSFAALKAGASEVVGIEARPDLVANAESALAEYGIDRSAYRFVASDVFTALQRETFQVDVVLCLGFFYHTLRYPELMSGIVRLGTRYLLLDTTVADAKKPVVRVNVDKAQRQSNATADAYSHRDKTLVGVPSMSALQRLLGVYEFEIDHLFDWAGLAEEVGVKRIKTYATGRRITARCRRREPVR